MDLDLTNAEAIRLVIWDLDETFWKGTLSEGGIEYIPEFHDIVITLAERGIMSSICSKNDFETVKKIMQEKGLWDYFIFPSINWETKAPRVAAIIEAVQLRTATVAFIDDNPMNLNEIRHYLPDVQVYDETVIRELPNNPLCSGKDDRALSRLKQYKMLETRKVEEMSSGGDNIAFLRASGIKLFIEYDIEKNIDRAVELINRTNQLNFTKKRLPDDPETARQQLREFMSDHMVKVGLIKVSDKYGDYGYCGFYASKGFTSQKLVYFCFSCRILNMGVETWIYHKLQCPELEVVGEVLLDVVNDQTNVDWIEQIDKDVAEGRSDARQVTLVDSLFIRGGCDLAAMSHYAGGITRELITEFPCARDDKVNRIDHSQFLRYAMEGRTLENSPPLALLGYSNEEFKTALLDIPKAQCNASIFSFWMDAHLKMFRHQDDVSIPVPFVKKEYRSNDGIPGFENTGRLSKEEFQNNLRFIFTAVREHVQVFVIGANEFAFIEGMKTDYKNFIKINRWTREVMAEFPNVTLVNIRDCAANEAEVRDSSHFDRMVYVRLMEKIRVLLKDAVDKKTAGIAC